MRTLALFLFLTANITLCSGQSYTFIFLNTKKDKQELPQEEVKKIMDGHLANIGRLAKEGKLIVAGPFEGGGGVFILNTTSLDTASKWLSTDPGIKANRWNVEMLPYQPRTGGVCAVGENYEMVFYQFLRYTPEATLTPESLNWHNDSTKKLIEQGSVIHEGTFGNKLGWIVVLKADALVDANPAVKGGLIKLETKKLYIAKGSFCEK